MTDRHFHTYKNCISS